LIVAFKRARLRWLPKAILALAASYFAFIALRAVFSNSIHAANLLSTDWSFKEVAVLICTALAILLALSLRLPSPTRSNVALLVAASGATILTVEVLLHWQNTSPLASFEEKTVSFALAAGRPVGQIDPLAFIRDLRRNGVPEVRPFVGPPHNQAYVSRPDGLRLITLAGISEVMTVTCNESGRFEPYFSDEHGFNNPLGLHDSGPLDVVLVGDSFTHSSCVRRADSVAGRIRTSIPRTLNLGIRGSGPLIHLAALIEYASAPPPRIVVWGWFEGNDLGDLTLEVRKPELERYLTAQAPFGLKALQEEVDFALRGLSTRAEFWSRGTILADLLMLRSTRGYLGAFRSYMTAPPSGVAMIEDVLGTARKLVSSWGGELVLVYQPYFPRYCNIIESESWRNECVQYPQYLKGDMEVRDEVIDLFKRMGMPFVDGHTAFLDTGRPEDMFFHPYSHYSPEGYRVIADAVLREIRPMLDHHPDRSPAAPAAPMAGNHP